MPSKEKNKTSYPQRYLSVEDVAQKLSVPTTKIYRMTREKTIPFYKLGKYCRFMESEIDEFMLTLRSKV